MELGQVMDKDGNLASGLGVTTCCEIALCDGDTRIPRDAYTLMTRRKVFSGVEISEKGTVARIDRIIETEQIRNARNTLTYTPLVSLCTIIKYSFKLLII